MYLFYFGTQVCYKCKTNPPFLRCMECGPYCLLCVDCDSDVHWLQPFHDREVWKDGYFQHIRPHLQLDIQSMTLQKQGIHSHTYVQAHVHVCTIEHTHTRTHTHIHMHTALHMHSHMHAFILLDICLCSLFLHVVRMLPSRFPTMCPNFSACPQD